MGMIIAELNKIFTWESTWKSTWESDSQVGKPLLEFILSCVALSARKTNSSEVGRTDAVSIPSSRIDVQALLLGRMSQNAHFNITSRTTPLVMCKKTSIKPPPVRIVDRRVYCKLGSFYRIMILILPCDTSIILPHCVVFANPMHWVSV
ncbi:MAG: hypothetical protein COZ49_00505 [Candidatus Yonathbacteria bacterium CG_4_10_14_3_um_filter_47_65]|uniref:Uncharacterized protein n=1 Tax=Candidatus Yonathbacteria bacterium CG_4_9_14_0_8_um_filter_46_47 TaxID=1975106 RepID=A0A2M8D999_9BACT|nr:MAG: hypothetical protein COX54_00640 [Candidatus Yonathbacteria bacterium CG23_combo_of_CG06-09_8_20_14_all_46_18]PIQ32656.1 MAG: hypothetical protein COW61_01195 [Candidatus Yonathbacteria bacterium CG17_big_fil_post_rev_8_21_14_2_50_46_19]PIX56731.1 MAG: hypothetical protein COZ49_00505 [Candidatus Yonathbacteria bacterium CG_4_10_14_3_um_filter_47_65]PJB83746.1 MAG: hypothetical protein CO088_00910 [Candidatus Yonathbacteria bacterium CG_4_9_14_0_8_um_filter_46_47]PJC21196.1 MAG: hypothe